MTQKNYGFASRQKLSKLRDTVRKREITEVMMKAKPERRLLAHVPDPDHIRSTQDRRCSKTIERKPTNIPFARDEGKRYESDFPVNIRRMGRKQPRVKGNCLDISQTGMLVYIPDAEIPEIDIGAICSLKFHIPSGTLGEGMDKTIRVKATVVRYDENLKFYGIQFSEPLYMLLARRNDRYTLAIASTFLFFISLYIMLMRYESILSSRFNSLLYLYSIMTAIFLLTRYLFGALYRPIPLDPKFTPGVTVIIPCFNEEIWIERTILSCIDQDYPVDKLEVIVVDDCSNDNSVAVIKDTVEKLHQQSERFKTQERVSYITLQKNAGKREALAAGIRKARHELVVFVDSDSFLQPDAIRNLVQPFIDPDIAGVSGRTDVANTYTNSITKMQAVRYYISFRIMKAAEAYFDSVMCLSGPLSCYRKSVVCKNLEGWLNQKFLRQKATFGDDRSMTNLIVKHNRTYYQDTAICSTIVPSRHKTFLKQQMRWKRSWLRESLVASPFMWRKEPFMAIFFYMGLLIPILAPIVVIYNLIYVPITYSIVPITFLTGLLMMALMMSFAQLLLRKSRLWFYGLWFCVYYEAVLLWQMPWAWMTFWFSTWGTRRTPQDILAEEKKRIRKKKEK